MHLRIIAEDAVLHRHRHLHTDLIRAACTPSSSTSTTTTIAFVCRRLHFDLLLERFLLLNRFVSLRLIELEGREAALLARSV